MKLSDYFDKMIAGQTLNYDELLKKLPRDARLDHHLIFAPHKLAPKKYTVEVLDKPRFVELVAQAASAQTRVEAAVLGDSHQRPTSFGHLLVFHQGLSDDRPDVVVIHNEQVAQPFTPKRQLLIIENEENFFRYAELLDLLGSFAGCQLTLSNTDIVYGAGNQINKGLNFSFFEQYHSVFCAFDWDLGGLMMYKTLSKTLGDAVKFLLPRDLSLWHSHFKLKPTSATQLLKAASLAQSLGFDCLAEAFRAKLCFLEQEVWLEVTPDSTTQA